MSRIANAILQHRDGNIHTGGSVIRTGRCSLAKVTLTSSMTAKSSGILDNDSLNSACHRTVAKQEWPMIVSMAEQTSARSWCEPPMRITLHIHTQRGPGLVFTMVHLGCSSSHPSDLILGSAGTKTLITHTTHLSRAGREGIRGWVSHPAAWSCEN